MTRAAGTTSCVGDAFCQAGHVGSLNVPPGIQYKLTAPDLDKARAITE